MKGLYHILQILLALTIPTNSSLAQIPTDYEEWWFWPENAGDCRIYVKEYPGNKPVYFISDLGMDFTYLEKHLTLDSAKFHEVFFDQPGITHSICYDSGAIQVGKVVDYLKIIQNEIHKEDSINIVCHRNGCALALSYYKKHPSAVASIHMVQPHIATKENGQLFLQIEDKRVSYMKDLNKAYGAVFFPEPHKWMLQSLSDQQKIPEKDVFFYLSKSKAKVFEGSNMKRVYKTKTSGNHNLDFLEDAGFWQALQSNLLKDE